MIENRISAVIENLPMHPVALLVKFLIQPFGARQQGPSDNLTRKCAEILLSPSETRERLTANLFLEEGSNGSLAALGSAIVQFIETQSLHDRLQDARCTDLDEALAKGLLNCMKLSVQSLKYSRWMIFPVQRWAKVTFPPILDKQEDS